MNLDAHWLVLPACTLDPETGVGDVLSTYCCLPVRGDLIRESVGFEKLARVRPGRRRLTAAEAAVATRQIGDVLLARQPEAITCAACRREIGRVHRKLTLVVERMPGG